MPLTGEQRLQKVDQLKSQVIEKSRGEWGSASGPGCHAHARASSRIDPFLVSASAVASFIIFRCGDSRVLVFYTIHI
jgi:hypothetical protein